MRTVRIKLYKLAELTEAAKKIALTKLADINTDDNWWDTTYEDAANIGLTITGFDLYHRTIEGELTESPPEVAEKIKAEHGADCATYKIASTFLHSLEALTGQYAKIEDCPEEEIEKLEDEFKEALLNEYHNLLRRDFDYLQTDEAIIETIEANDYEFYASGKQFTGV